MSGSLPGAGRRSCCTPVAFDYFTKASIRKPRSHSTDCNGSIGWHYLIIIKTSNHSCNWMDRADSQLFTQTFRLLASWTKDKCSHYDAYQEGDLLKLYRLSPTAWSTLQIQSAAEWGCISSDKNNSTNKLLDLQCMDSVQLLMVRQYKLPFYKSASSAEYEDGIKMLTEERALSKVTCEDEESRPAIGLCNT